MFTRRDTGEHLRAPLMQACHRRLRGGRGSIPHPLAVLGRWKESLQGRGEVAQCQQGSSGPEDRDDCVSNYPEREKEDNVIKKTLLKYNLKNSPEWVAEKMCLCLSPWGSITEREGLLQK